MFTLIKFMASLLINLRIPSVINLYINKLKVQKKKLRNYPELFTRVNMSGYVIANIDVKNPCSICLDEKYLGDGALFTDSDSKI